MLLQYSAGMYNMLDRHEINYMAWQNTEFCKKQCYSRNICTSPHRMSSLKQIVIQCPRYHRNKKITKIHKYIRGQKSIVTVWIQIKKPYKCITMLDFLKYPEEEWRSWSGASFPTIGNLGLVFVEANYYTKNTFF